MKFKLVAWYNISTHFSRRVELFISSLIVSIFMFNGFLQDQKVSEPHFPRVLFCNVSLQCLPVPLLSPNSSIFLLDGFSSFISKTYLERRIPLISKAASNWSSERIQLFKFYLLDHFSFLSIDCSAQNGRHI